MSPSSKITYNLLHNEDQAVVTVFVPGEPMRSAGDTHPAFDQAADLLEQSRQAYRDGDADTGWDLGLQAYELIDLERAITKRFDQLSERVSVHSGRVYFDGDAVEGPLMDQIMRLFEEGGDFKPLVNFWEKLETNPLGHAREALFAWVDSNGLTITPEGNVIGYKRFESVTDEQTGEIKGYHPSRRSSNPDRVNGVEVEIGEYMLVNPGDVVETPRSMVLHEPSTLCAEGLHVGNWSYSFVGDAKFSVEFSPAFVVNVPNSGGKLRVSRYKLLEIVSDPYSEAVLDTSDLRTPDYDEDDLYEDYEDEDDLYGDEDEDEDEGWLGDSKPTTGPTSDDLGLSGIDLSDLGLYGQSAVNAAQVARDALGRFLNGSGGRPGSQRDSNGRFSG